MYPSKATGCSPCSDTGWNTALVDCSGLRPESTRQNQHPQSLAVESPSSPRSSFAFNFSFTSMHDKVFQPLRCLMNSPTSPCQFLHLQQFSTWLFKEPRSLKERLQRGHIAIL